MSTAPPSVARALPVLRRTVADWHRTGQRVALVPTMGALHQGHLQLVRLAGQRAERCIVSIFVNPTQFAPHEDLARYPRDEAGDLAKLTDVGCDLVWAPDAATMYSEGFATRVIPGGPADGLESDFRPHFFAGVATVCCKLFTQTGADFAVFGEKDYQQLCVVRQMVRDLDLPLEIVAAPTVREADGLAMSSRNRYLSVEERAAALMLHRAIARIAEASADDRETAIQAAKRHLAAAGFKLDYLELRETETLKVPEPGTARPLRVLVAAWLGKTRLIDNLPAAGKV